MYKKCFLWVATLAWTMLIFLLSSQPAESSAAMSSSVLEQLLKVLPVIKNLSPDVQQQVVFWLHVIVRKMAHFSLYGVLGLLVYGLHKTYGAGGIKAIIRSLSICCLYAISDEAHQLFVEGRGCRLYDVLIDTFGAFFGILVAQGFLRILKKKQ
ncbi:MAG: VanZ family protein [Clostridia bacterium]|nr:VanZ family protein [Clostridia bacterium]